MANTDISRSPKIRRVKTYTGAFCCVPLCSNSRGKDKLSGKQLSYYSFPKEEKRTKTWLSLIRRSDENDEDWRPSKWSKICSEHFEGGKKSDDPTSVSYHPSIFPRQTTPKARNTQTSSKSDFTTPTARPTNRKRRPTVDKSEIQIGRPAPKRLRYYDEDSGNSVWTTTDHDYVKTKTVRSADDDELQEKVHRLEIENELLRSRIFSLDNIKEDDSKFSYWTNLPNYQVFEQLCFFLKPRAVQSNLRYWKGESTCKSKQHSESMSYKPGPERKLSFEEEFFMVLVKLKTGAFNNSLAQQFNISIGYVSKIFSSWINFLAIELKSIFEMPEDDSEGIPDCFKNFPDLQVVLDCTELMLQKASNLSARKKTFSNYKNNDTAKFLVGLAPNWTVNYISKAWGGRASDKHITVNSEPLMNRFEPGKEVMVDRGFTITEELKKLGVKLLIPKFKGSDRSQFAAEECEQSEFIAKARIHIERVIQRIKTFNFLGHVIRLNMIDIVEQIFTVCAYLANLQLPIIQK